ncbi:hypothetical protein M0R45_031321 [Rubus argutus]|uniref:Uncharacterized protein n=1 Tax=Rubus argutus TaxID=59490 RepID=A0AAW1WDQ7_RUBAR
MARSDGAARVRRWLEKAAGQNEWLAVGLMRVRRRGIPGRGTGVGALIEAMHWNWLKLALLAGGDVGIEGGRE